jgi:hypothetical protein
MTGKRLSAAVFALGLGLMLGSCSSFSDAVSDHWPHFAGGEPGGLPPRPGDPGYAQFIAHGQPSETTNSTAGNGQPVAAGATSPVIEQRPLGDVQHAGSGAGAAPSAAPSAAGPGSVPRAPLPSAAPLGATNDNVGQGGLY